MSWGFVGDAFGSATDYVGNAFSDAGSIGAAAGEGLGASTAALDLTGMGTGAATDLIGTGAGVTGIGASGLSDALAGAGSMSGIPDFGGVPDYAGVGSMVGIGGSPGGSAGGVGGLTQQVATQASPSLGGASLTAPTPGPLGSAASTAAPSGVSSFLGFGESDAGNSLVGANGQYTTPPIPPSSVDAAGNPVYGDQATFDAAQAQQSGASPSAGGSGGGNSISAAFKDPSLSTIGTALGNNANWLVPGAALGASALLGNAQPKGSAQVSQQAAQLSAAGQQLQSYITNGTLPPGVQSSINSASETAKAAVRSQYAKSGMSGSSAEAADLAYVETQAISQGTQIALQLLQQGVTDTQLSAQLYSSLMQSAISSDKNLVTALGSMAGSAARSTIQVTGG